MLITNIIYHLHQSDVWQFAHNFVICELKASASTALSL